MFSCAYQYASVTADFQMHATAIVQQLTAPLVGQQKATNTEPPAAKPHCSVPRPRTSILSGPLSYQTVTALWHGLPARPALPRSTRSIHLPPSRSAQSQSTPWWTVRCPVQRSVFPSGPSLKNWARELTRSAPDSVQWEVNDAVGRPQSA